MTVNLSLIEQSLGRATHNYWLRVGVMFDEDSAQSATSADTGSPSLPYRNADVAVAKDGGTGDEVFDAGRAVESTEDEIDLAQPSIADAGLEQSGLGSAGDSANDGARGQDQVQGRGVEAERLYTLAVLSSDVAKWLIPRLDDWVELSAVRSKIRILFARVVVVACCVSLSTVSAPCAMNMMRPWIFEENVSICTICS
jgi:hypothetical protein